MSAWAKRVARVVAVSTAATMLLAGCDTEEEPTEVVEQQAEEAAAIAPELEFPEDIEEESTGDEFVEQLPDWLQKIQGTEIDEDGRVDIELTPPREIRERYLERGQHDYDPRDWPEPYDQWTEIEVLTPEGVATLALEKLRRHTRKGGKAFEFTVHSEESEILVESEISATFAAPPGLLNPDARIAYPDPVEFDDNRLRGVWVRFLDSLDDRNRQSVEHRVAETFPEDVGELARYVDAWDLEFSDGFDKLVTVNVDSGTADGYRCYSAGFTVDEQGIWYELFDGGRALIHCVEPDAFVDRDGDGRWGMIYSYGIDSRPYTQKWVEFDPEGQPRIESLRHWH